ncbi:UNVERIFIED_CONTAM: hypothetical protein PYX00_011038 [Menopon gallinae]|uniref:CCHC-type domain-containing protein n=1 Tax=Menopon gallinae TaxID=328185 RepID=A0AAW2H6A8_9NEOP
METESQPQLQTYAAKVRQHMQKPRQPAPIIIRAAEPVSSAEEAREMKKIVLSSLAPSATGIRIKYVRGVKQGVMTGRKETTRTTWVATVAPDIRTEVIAAGRLYIGWTACRVTDYCVIARCYQCQRFGHMSKYCRGQETCEHCAQQGHNRRTCPNLHQPASCPNCQRVRKPHQHEVTDRNCPTYQAYQEIEMQKTRYGH